MANDVDIDGLILDSQSKDGSFKHSIGTIREDVDVEQPECLFSFFLYCWNICINVDDLPPENMYED